MPTATVTAGFEAAYAGSVPATAALDPGLHGVLRVVGGPGTGKTTLLVDAAVARIAAGAEPESVLVLTGSGPLGAQARGSLTTRLLSACTSASGLAAVREPAVRSVHAYAFAVLRLAAQRRGVPPPRLITAAEQDGVIRDLLSGDIEDGAAMWPGTLRAALGTDGFATELRDLLARCAERGVDPVRLQRIGRSAGRPEWVAAGRFAQQYEQVMLLRSAVGMAAPHATVPALGAAELVGAALEAFAVDPGLLGGEHTRIRTLLVDDVQQLDPQAAHLVRVLAGGVDATVLAGDPDEAVFGFRGADPALLFGSGTPTVRLQASHRCAPAIARATSGVARLLPGRSAARDFVGAGGVSGSVSAILAVSEHAEASVVADLLRRAHLVDKVAWSQMAVIVRSVPRAGAGLIRALAAAGVPVAPPAFDGPLPDNAVVSTLLTALAAAADGLTAARADALLCGPIGRVDPVTLRQIRRSLRRVDAGVPSRDFGGLLVAALEDGIPGSLPEPHARPLRRVRSVLQAAGFSSARDPRSVLWQAWQRSGLERRLLTTAERDGQAGLQATQNLNAVTTLFEIVDEYTSCAAAPSITGLIDHIGVRRLPVRAPEPVQTPDAVTVLSPHQALGREWDLVIIAGLQEGLWPNATPRGGVLATHRLVDILDDVDGEVSVRAPVIADERRLLIAAMGRARNRLVVTAVDSGAGDGSTDLEVPSPFFYDIARYATDGEGGLGAGPPVSTTRVLSAPAVVGQLRNVVCAPDSAIGDEARRGAAVQLARLAAAGVPGADPADWYGMTPDSSTEPIWSGADHVVTMSPSTLQTLLDCPLRWLLERHGGRNAAELRTAAGSLIHALIAQPGKSPARMAAELEQVWTGLPYESEWFARNELDRHRAMLTAFSAWREVTRPELTEVGTEVEVDGVLDAGRDAGHLPVRVRGRIDRLERDAQGRLVVVDAKTGKSPVSKDDAQNNAQLALYQLAIANGLVSEAGPPGGARLVYIAKAGANGVTERGQDAPTPQTLGQWRQQVNEAAAQTAGPQFAARVNDGCPHCPIRPICPAHRIGREAP